MSKPKKQYCKHTKADVYADSEEKGKVFAECPSCGTQGPLCSTVLAARAELRAIRVLRTSRLGGARENSGRKSEIDGGTTTATFNLGNTHLARLEAWAKKRRITNRSAAMRALLDSFFAS